MAKILQASAVVCGTLGLVFVIAAMATSGWMRGCLSVDKLMQAVSSMNDQSAPQANDNVMNMLRGQKLCFETGLFQLSMSLGSIINYKISISFNAMDHFIQATAGLLIVGTILLVPAIILVTLGACSDSMSEQRKNSAHTCTRIGCMIFVIAALVIGAGSLTYTIPQSKTVHNPTRFMQQIYVSMYKGMSEMMAGGGGSTMNMNEMFGIPEHQPGGNGGDQSSMSDLKSLLKNNENVDLSETGNSGVKSRGKRQSEDYVFPSSKPISGYAPREDFSSSNNNYQQMQQAMMMEMIKDLDPMYAYSFFMAWISFALVLLTAVLTAQAYRNMRLYNSDNYRVPML